jgi:hypothetical protein
VQRDRPIEGEQAMVVSPLAPVPLEQQTRRKKSERHAVTAVPKREQMLRVVGMRSDVGQTVGRRGEQPFPREIGVYVFERRIAPFELLPDACRAIA